VKHLDRAIAAADWIRNGQVLDPASMDLGRFVRNYSIGRRQVEDLGSNWYSGLSMFALLLLRDLDHDRDYLAAAGRATHYLRILQQLLPDDPAARWSILEESPASLWCHPRDALSGAWGMLRLHRATGSAELRARVEGFAGWHRGQAMRGGYPVWTMRFDGRPNDLRLGSFQSGSALFYQDLYELTGDPAYRIAMDGVLTYFIEHFFSDAGGLEIVYDDATGRCSDTADPRERVWCDMHRFNDDFGCAAAVAAFHLTGTRLYGDYITRYLDWILSRQHDDGSFGEHRLAVSSCVAAQNLLNGFLATGRGVYREAAYRALAHLQDAQLLRPHDPAVHGGVPGMAADCGLGNGTIDLRATMYTVFTEVLFHLYETFIVTGRGAEIPAAVRLNPMLGGLRFVA
jgi:hypothetical protein